MTRPLPLPLQGSRRAGKPIRQTLRNSPEPPRNRPCVLRPPWRSSRRPIQAGKEISRSSSTSAPTISAGRSLPGWQGTDEPTTYHSSGIWRGRPVPRGWAASGMRRARTWRNGQAMAKKRLLLLLAAWCALASIPIPPAGAAETLEVTPNSIPADVATWIAIRHPESRFNETSRVVLSQGSVLATVLDGPSQIRALVLVPPTPSLRVKVLTADPLNGQVNDDAALVKACAIAVPLFPSLDIQDIEFAPTPALLGIGEFDPFIFHRQGLISVREDQLNSLSKFEGFIRTNPELEDFIAEFSEVYLPQLRDFLPYAQVDINWETQYVLFGAGGELLGQQDDQNKSGFEFPFPGAALRNQGSLHAIFLIQEVFSFSGLLDPSVPAYCPPDSTLPDPFETRVLVGLLEFEIQLLPAGQIVFDRRVENNAGEPTETEQSQNNPAYTIAKVTNLTSAKSLSPGAWCNYSGIQRYRWQLPSQEWSSDPVDLSSLEYLYFAKLLSIPSRGFDLTIQATYRSRIKYQSRLGYGWELDCWSRLHRDGERILFYSGFGRGDAYLPDGNGGFISPTGQFTKLVRNADGTYVLRWPNGFRYLFHGEEGLATDLALAAQIDPNGNRQDFLYDGEGKLVQIVDTMGRSVDLLYDDRGFLTKIRDFAGREVVFEQNELGDLLSIRSPVVSFSGNPFPAGKTWSFTYSSGFADAAQNHNLLTVTAPQENHTGLRVPNLVNVYDEADRVIRQTWGGTNENGVPAGGDLAYAQVENPDGTRTTVFTDRNGNVTEFEIEAGRIVGKRERTRGLRDDDPSFFETRWEFDEEGRSTRSVYPEGNETRFEYDTDHPSRLSRGNLLAVRHLPDAARGADQPELVVRYKYEPLYNQVSEAIEFRGNDPAYVPQNGGTATPERYTTRIFYGYQESGNALPGRAGLDVATEAATFGIPFALLDVGLGDLNEDGEIDDNCACLIRIESPSVRLAPSGKQKDVEGGLVQRVVQTMALNEIEEYIRITDPEGNVTTLDYYPEADPDGDGLDYSASRDPVAGGYLRSVTVDADDDSPRRRRDVRPPERIRTRFFWDRVGNPRRVVDGRGIATDMVFNELNQLVRVIRAADVSEVPGGMNLEAGIDSFKYRADVQYDANDRVARTLLEYRDGNVDTLGTSIESLVLYDILDNPIELRAEISEGIFQTWRIRYDPNENAVELLTPLAVSGAEPGNVMATAWDERDLALSRTLGFGSPEASTNRFFYDKNGNLVAAEDAQDNTGGEGPERSRFVYDGFDRLVRAIDALGNRAQSRYDPASNVVEASFFGHPAGPSPTDDSGSGAILLARGFASYDELSRAFQLDQELFVDADTRGRLKRPADLQEGALTPGDNKVTTLLEYDRSSRRTFTTTDDLEVFHTRWDGMNRVTVTGDPLGNEVELFYDKNSNVLRVVEREQTPDGRLRETFEWLAVFDSLDRLIRTTDPVGQTRRLVYDSRDFVIRHSDAQGPLSPDPLGLFTKDRINTTGNDGEYFHDGLGRLFESRTALRRDGQGGNPLDTTNSANPDGLITLLSSFDANSRLVSQTDDNGNRTSHEYDPLNRVVREIFADGTANVYEYDRDHNLVQTLDANGTVRQNEHDGLNRLVRSRFQLAAGIVGTTLQTFEYDGAGRLRRAQDLNDPGTGDDDSDVVRHHDSLSRLLEEVQNGRAVDYAYVADDDIKKVTYPDGRVLDYGLLDPLDRVRKLVFDGKEIADYRYIGPSRTLERLYPNGTRLTFLDSQGNDVGYDGLRRVVNLRHVKAPGKGKRQEELVAGFDYTYNRENMILTESRTHDGGRGFVAKYDSTYRVVEFTDNVNPRRGHGQPRDKDTVSQSWSLDGAGNWKTFATGGQVLTNLVNQMNEYTSFASKAQEHDENGNRKGDGKRSYVWDALDRLREVRTLDKKKIVARYAYDAFGRRISKFVTKDRLDEMDAQDDDDGGDDDDDDDSSDLEKGGKPGRLTFFFYSGWRDVEERNSKDNVLVQYVDGRWIDEHLAIVVYDGKGRGDGDRKKGRVFFYHEDQRPANVIALTDERGEVAERFRYDAYGKVTFLNKEGKARKGPRVKENSYFFQGRRLDLESGLYYFRHRYYDPEQGRWVSRESPWYDPGNNGNGFGFVGANGINGVDPGGLGWEPAWVAEARRRAAILAARAAHAVVGEVTKRVVQAAPAVVKQVATAQAKVVVQAATLPPAIAAVQARESLANVGDWAKKQLASMGLSSTQASSTTTAPTAPPQVRGGPGAGGPAVAVTIAILLVLAELAHEQPDKLKRPPESPPRLPPREDPPIYVVRGGMATPENLQAGSAEHRGVPGVLGFSVQSAPGVSVEDLARAGRFPNVTISVTTVARLQAAGAAVGVVILVVPSPGAGYHATVTTPVPLSFELATALSCAFDRRPNPYPHHPGRPRRGESEE
ncbi:MAG: RHS repeat protein [Planctomycetes bacterium]|nr:RHS repeat protein [Planctomycetota bacterium]